MVRLVYLRVLPDGFPGNYRDYPRDFYPQTLSIELENPRATSILEILSDSTAKTDREEKKQIYQDTFRTPDYFWFDPESLEFQGFTLVRGRYQAIRLRRRYAPEPNDRGWLWSEQLELYLGIHDEKLRYFTPEGELVLTPTEVLRQAENQALEAEDRAVQERQKAERLAARLRELGIDPDEIL